MVKSGLRPGFVRFSLALIVIVYHLVRFTFLGEFAVECFFILSGYWISLMYTEKYSKKENVLKVFYISRLWRLLPVFYAFSLLGLVARLLVSHDLINKYHALASTTEKSIFWLSNVSILTYNSSTLRILNPAWSLDIELQFYFLFPILAYLATRWKNSLGLLIIVFFALSTITWTYYLQNGINSTVISYLYLFLVGMAVYYKNLQFSPRVQITGFILLLAILGLQVFLIAGSENHPSYTSRYAFKLLTLAGVICALPILAGSVRVKSNARDKWYGEMSYLVYLSHWVWIIPYSVLIAQIQHKYLRIPYIALFLLATFASSWAIYLLIDRRSERFRSRWVREQKEKKNLEVVGA